jgi:hypothetical protein
VEGAKTCDKLEETTERTNGWFVGFVEKINGMIEVGKDTKEIDAVIKEEEAKLEVVLKESKQECEDSEVTGSVSGSISFYDRLNWSVKSQVDDIKKTIKESSEDETKVVEKIDVEAVKTQLEKTTCVELSKAKIEIKKEEEKETIVSKTEDEQTEIVVVTKDQLTCKFFISL